MIEIYVASAFSKDNMGGNKAGVVMQNSNLNVVEKTKIAFQLGYSETAFVSQSNQANFRLEYFTPAGEVPLCGHATIATFVVLKHLHILKKSDYLIETKSGILKIKVDPNDLIFMEQNAPKFYEKLNNVDIDECFSSNVIVDTLPIQIVSTGLRDILVPIDSSKILESIIPNFVSISKISKKKNCVGIHAFSLINDSDITAVCRNFAPLYGINEEAATGTSNCALACYLYKYKFKQNQYIFEQGYNLNSISKIYVNIESENEIIKSVYVGGYGYLVCKKMVAI